MIEKAMFINELKKLCIGEDMPDSTLHSEGCFPTGWVERYLNLLEQNRMFWQNIDNWPKELSHCFYRVGFHVGYAYDEWLRAGGEKNLDTEKHLVKVRMFTDAFIAGGADLKWNLEE